MYDKFCIFRSTDQGVVCGYLRSMAGRSAEIDEARQIHGWDDGANTLIEMSNRGCGTARISEPAALPFLMLDICGVYQCTPEAAVNLSQSRWNAPYDASKSSRKKGTGGS